MDILKRQQYDHCAWKICGWAAVWELTQKYINEEISSLQNFHHYIGEFLTVYIKYPEIWSKFVCILPVSYIQWLDCWLLRYFRIHMYIHTTIPELASRGVELFRAHEICALMYIFIYTFFLIHGEYIADFWDLYAGCRIKVARGKSLDSRNFGLEFFFPNSILQCSFFGAVEWIQKSPLATFSQPMFLTNIRTALFEK